MAITCLEVLIFSLTKSNWRFSCSCCFVFLIKVFYTQACKKIVFKKKILVILKEFKKESINQKRKLNETFVFFFFLFFFYSLSIVVVASDFCKNIPAKKKTKNYFSLNCCNQTIFLSFLLNGRY